jgi:hypothetical protein
LQHLAHGLDATQKARHRTGAVTPCNGGRSSDVSRYAAMLTRLNMRSPDVASIARNQTTSQYVPWVMRRRQMQTLVRSVADGVASVWAVAASNDWRIGNCPA